MPDLNDMMKALPGMNSEEGRYRVLSEALLGDRNNRDKGRLRPKQVAKIAYLRTQCEIYPMPVIAALIENYLAYSVSQDAAGREGFEGVFTRLDSRSESFLDSFGNPESDVEKIFGMKK